MFKSSTNSTPPGWSGPDSVGVDTPSVVAEAGVWLAPVEVGDALPWPMYEEDGDENSGLV